MNPMPAVCRPLPLRVRTQGRGQYLAFIHAYTLVLGRPPAEADLQRQFRVTPPRSTRWCPPLKHAGFIRRQPGLARSMEVLPDPTALPRLQILRAEVLGDERPLGRTKLAPPQMTWKTYNKMMIGMGMPTAHRSMPRIIEFSSAFDAPDALLPV
jgi:hypothetical protein